jgi:hypothetical protein
MFCVSTKISFSLIRKLCDDYSGDYVETNSRKCRFKKHMPAKTAAGWGMRQLVRQFALWFCLSVTLNESFREAFARMHVLLPLIFAEFVGQGSDELQSVVFRWWHTRCSA